MVHTIKFKITDAQLRNMKESMLNDTIEEGMGEVDEMQERLNAMTPAEVCQEYISYFSIVEEENWGFEYEDSGKGE